MQVIIIVIWSSYKVSATRQHFFTLSLLYPVSTHARTKIEERVYENYFLLLYFYFKARILTPKLFHIKKLPLSRPTWADRRWFCFRNIAADAYHSGKHDSCSVYLSSFGVNPSTFIIGHFYFTNNSLFFFLENRVFFLILRNFACSRFLLSLHRP